MLAAALAVVGLSAPASADPAPRNGDYLQPDVPRSLDVGLLPATGDKRFVHPKAKPALPARDKAGRTFVYVEGTSAAAAKAAVRDAGGQVLQTNGKRVRAAVAGAKLATLAKESGVSAVRQPDRAFPLAVTSEGVESSGADAWIRAGRTGAGVKVGIVDVGFEGLSDAQDAGELPAGVTLHGDDCPAENGSSHGTAVAEIVHDMAPGADLYLACAPDSMTFASAVQWLTSQHVQIINAAIGFPSTGRGDGSGPDGSPAAVVKQARQAGILWVSAAGNQAQLHWSGPAADANNDGYVEANGTAVGNGFNLPPSGTATVSLRWDAWPTTRQDLDLMVLSSNHVPTGPSDPAIVAQSTNAQATAPSPLPPTEQVTIENTTGGSQTYWIYVAAKASYPTTKADVFVMGDATSLSYPVAAGSVLEPATSPYAMAVGASAIGSGRVDAYSSQGPTVDGRTKPDIVGQSGVSTFTYGPAPTMAGTSPASAHVAGAAALLEGANSDLDAGQVEAMLEGRTSPSKFDNQWGHGLLALGSAGTTQPASASGFTPLQEPQRLIDTSSSTSLHPSNFGAGEVYTLPVTGLPTDATAVAVNLTAWSANRTHVDLYRDVDTYGGVSTVELQPNEKRTSMAIVPLSAARTIAIRNDAGSAGLNVDLLGYFSPTSSGTYFPADAPRRVLDTHTAVGGHNAPFGAGETYALPVRGVAGVPSDATAVLVDVGLTEASAATYLQVFPQVAPARTGTLETDPNGVRSNLAVTGIGDDGAIRIHNQTGTAAVTVDLLGWFAPGSGAKYVPLARATKVLDTRTGTGGPIGPIGQAANVPLSVSDVAGVPRNITAPVLAVAAGGDGNSSLSAGPAERGWSGLADVQGLQPQSTVAETIVPRAGDSGTIRIRNEAGATDLTAAVTGYFVGGAPLAEQTGSCAIDAEAGFTPIFDGRSPQSSEWRQAGTAGPINTGNCELSSSPNDSFLWYSAEDLPAEYTLRLDYKTTSDSSDSGILLGFGAPPSGSIAAAGGKEVQIKPNGSTITASGAIYGTQEPSAQAEKPAGQWNAAEVTVSGKRITVKINDVVVNDFVVTSADQLKDPGYIGLQGSVAGDLVTFRDVRVRADKPSARYGTITGNGGQCVDVYNAGHASATALQSIPCRDGDDAQFFTLPGDGTLRVFGLCVDATGPARSGTYLFVQTYTCNGAPSQQWVPRADGTLYSATRNACLDAPATGTLHLYTFTCTATSNQLWQMPATQARFGPVFASAFPGLCVDVVNQQAAAGASVQDASCKDDIGSQQWTVPGDGTLRIYGFCLDENGPIRASSDRWLQLSACNGSATEQWSVRPGEGLYNPATNRCVDGFNIAAAGGRLEAYPCNGKVNQEYSIPALGLGAGMDRSAAAHLVASYAMNENNGTITADGTAGARTQTLTGGPTWATGHEGSSLSFNGTSAYTTTPRTTLQTNRSYSISAWAMVTSSPAGSSRAIVAQDATGRTPFVLMSYAAGNEWEFAVTQASASTAYTRIGAGSGSLVLNRWTHLVGVYDAEAGQARLYVDGVLKNTVHVEGLWLASGATVIGRTWWSGGPDDFFAGQIDDVQLYQGVLTQDQIIGLSRS
ncbi:ricin-type beta-trefoil lectin domain protein [Actinoplanes sp. NPDC051343]|uniref:ricin-type beta-trefoil lectin domain protein n=1 Tax=Actinoplanes sp. NPDC051343 TaxID=3363906 RepID=UPI0037A0FED9